MPTIRKSLFPSPSILPLLCATGITLLLGATGCQDKKESASPPPASNTTATTASTGVSDEQAKKFLTALEGQATFDARLQYVNAHQAEASLVAQSKDPSITQKFSQLMSPPQMQQPGGPH